MSKYSNSNYLHVAAFQGTIDESNTTNNLLKTISIMEQAEKEFIDILLMPECYLHGYFSTREETLEHAIDLTSDDFKQLCNKFKSFKKTTLLLGLNEIEDEHIYNTVVVIEGGILMGRYRKAYTYKPYDFYSLGRDFPVFNKHEIPFSIITCYDSAFREPALISAFNGAKIIFCPMFNRSPHDARMVNYLLRKSHLVTRAFDSECWLIVSDIICDEKDRTCPGSTCIIDHDGEVVAKAQLFHEMILSYRIPLDILNCEAKLRLKGDNQLFEILSNSYKNNRIIG